MGGRKNWTIRSFLFCFICNGILIAIFLASKRIYGEVTTPIILVAGGILTLVLWLLFLSASPRPENQIPSRQIPEEQLSSKKVPKEQAPSKTVPPPIPKGPASPDAAIQILAALQREGRLIDFLQEDLSTYEDSQIGAAVRNIHMGCKETLREHMEIKSIFQEKEGTAVAVPPGFDVRAIRLTGNVTGNPPFRGILRHRGWQVERIRLPQGTEQKNHWILAPAEIEIE